MKQKKKKFKNVTINDMLKCCNVMLWNKNKCFTCPLYELCEFLDIPSLELYLLPRDLLESECDVNNG